MNMVKPIGVEARQGYCIWVKFEDGTAGEVDLSDIAGKGIFKALEDREFFETVSILPHYSISWGGTDEFEICPDSIYLELTGKTSSEVGRQDRAFVISA